MTFKVQKKLSVFFRKSKRSKTQGRKALPESPTNHGIRSKVFLKKNANLGNLAKLHFPKELFGEKEPRDVGFL